MSKIVLLYPPLSLTGRYKQIASGSEVYPHGLCILAAVARNHGITPIIIDSKAKGYNEDITAEKILVINPDYVGITASTMLIRSAANICEKIKRENPEIITLVGGPHISAVPLETMQQFPFIDIGIIKEGEETLPELCRAIEAKSPLDKVRGIIVRRNGRIIRTEDRPYIKDLDALPMPAWDLLPDLLKDYQQSMVRVEKVPSISLITSRGCPCKCTFCARNVFGNDCRCYSASRVMEMVCYLKEKYKIRSIAIEDENFVVFKKRLKELCHRFIDDRIDMSWSCAARVDQVDIETLMLMRRAGCWSISYGIESGSSEILDTVKKGISKKKIVEALENTRKAGIESKGYFIIGLPGETINTIRETRQFALSIPLDYLQMSFLCVFPGTEIAEHADRYGVYDNDWDTMNIWTPNFIPHGLTKEILVRESKKIFRSFYFRPKIIVKFVLKLFNLKYFFYYCKDGFKILKFLLSNR